MLNKGYIQEAQKLEEFKEAFLNQKKDEHLGEILLLEKPYQTQLEKFFLTSAPSKKGLYKFMLSRKSLKIVKTIELIEPVLELEINRASLKLAQLRDELECVDISGEIWNYTKSFIRDISDKFWNKFGRHLPKPKFEFIDESIEIRWIRSNCKFVLSITDYFDDIIVYVKPSKGQYFSQPVSKNEIGDWVFFWLKQIWNF